jgi:Protein kinase G tetratricopeptide repeat
MTTATVKCTQPGCDGTMQDGYCTTCGLAAPAPAPACVTSGLSGPSGPSASSGSSGTSRSSESSRGTRSRGRGGSARGTVRSVRGRLGAGLVDWCTSGQPVGAGRILGCEPNARDVRFGLERAYRALAGLTPDQGRRIELVDMANAIRPRTLT